MSIKVKVKLKIKPKNNESDEYIFNYFKEIKIIINNILKTPTKNILTYDILDNEKTMQNKLIILKEKQRQMKIGKIWQAVLGCYKSFINLGEGHETGLDIISYDRKIIIELKNRTNTDNSSSRKTKYDKLADFKMKNPDYTCIYACINDDTENKTQQGCINILKHNNVEIQYYVGYAFLNYILESDAYKIIDFIKKTIFEEN